MQVFTKRWLVVFVLIKPYLCAQQQMSTGYQDILKSAFGLPPEMHSAIGEKSGGAISFRQDSMVMYRPIAQATIKANMSLTSDLLPGIKHNFLKQLEWLMSPSGVLYDGPNYQGIAIKGIPQEDASYDYWGASDSSLKSEIELFDIASDKMISSNLISNFKVSVVAIAPSNNNIIAYAGNTSAVKKQTIYWTDLKNKRDIQLPTLDTPVKRLQFYSDNKLYALCNEKLYLFDITEAGVSVSDQTIKDAKGSLLLMDDFVLNKTDSNFAAAIINSGLYILNIKTRKFKKINDMPGSVSAQRLAFSDNQIGIVSRLGDGSMHVVVIEPGLYSISE